MTPGPSERLLTADQAAELLGQKSRTFRLRFRDWGIPAVRVGRSLRFREASIRAWILDHEVRQ